MKLLATEIEINADANRVWQVLTDFAAYPEWNPFVLRAEGELIVGRRLRVDIKPPGGSVMSFRPRVLVADPGRELRWSGKLWIPGFFDGEHSFVIQSSSEGRVHFTQSEEFRGLLVSFLWKQIDTKVRRGFEAMNHALNSRVESMDSTRHDSQS